MPAVLIVYFVLRPKYRNFFLLAASYYFYMNWRAEYAALIFISTLSTYLCAICLEKCLFNKRKFWLVASLLLNLSILFFFKYYNFFAEMIVVLLNLLPNAQTGFTPLNILLPVGVSFYTFQALGYTIDVYRKKIPAERNFIDYALFVSFFPQLVAGPIERSTNLLPQFKRIHKFSIDNFHEGFLLILWGLFKKTLIADRLAVLVNTAYAAETGDVTAAGYITAAVSFALQIYCDFSAYSDIARGSAKILGFSLIKNFDAPYTSASVREFWRKWHISLCAWFKDYLYIPLGGNRKGVFRHYLNIMLVFCISGLWHGASLSFIFWGFLNGLYQVLENMLKSLTERLGVKLKKNILLSIAGCAVTFPLVTYAFIFFRAPTITDGLNISAVIFNTANLKNLSFACILDMGLSVPYLWVLAAGLALLAAVDIAGRFLEGVKKISRTFVFKYAAYFILIMSLIIFGHYGSSYDPQEFIYFQF